MLEVVILIGLYVMPKIKERSIFGRGRRKGTSHSNVPSVFITHSHTHSGLRTGEKERI
jgi:hypothetical protein